MKQSLKVKEFSKDYSNTIIRFPVTIILLIAATITTAISINNHKELYLRLVVTFLLGAFIYAVFQLIYERFYKIPTIRYFLMGASIVLSLIYYLIIRKAEWNIELTVRTTVIFFILLIAFLWVPVIKSRINFNESFLAAFKAFFVSVFFNIVLFLGVTLVIGATNILIVDVNEESYAHAANLIFILLAPTHFLALIPYYPSKEEILSQTPYHNTTMIPQANIIENSGISTQNSPLPEEMMVNESELITIKSEQQRREEALVRFTSPVKFLEALISYVIIPLTTAFTIILLLYIIMNITGDFWSGNLMEPLLVSYSFIVIIVYLLSSTIHNAFTKYFLKIFPKVLVPIVLFQTVSSILRIGEVGITYGRYYAIMFGVFSTIAGIIFCVKPVHKNGLIAPILITLSVISIFPMIDVFTLSRLTQMNRLVETLEKNEMLDGETITPKANISEKDKKTIISSLQYLNQMNYTKDIVWLEDYSTNYDFKRTFGFDEYEQVIDEGKDISIYRKQTSAIPVTGYDFIMRVYVSSGNDSITIDQFEKDGIKYQLRVETATDQFLILEKDGTEIIRFNMSKIYANYSNESTNNKLEVNTEDLTFIEDNSSATLTVVAENININTWTNGKNEQADIYVLVKIKE